MPIARKNVGHFSFGDCRRSIHCKGGGKVQKDAILGWAGCQIAHLVFLEVGYFILQQVSKVGIGAFDELC